MMPKVDKITMKIKGELRTFEIWFNTKEDFFIKDFPEEISRISGISINGQSSLGKLKDVAADAVYKFHEITAEQRKVIAYRLALSSGFHMNKGSDDGRLGGSSYIGTQKWVPQGSQGKIEGFGFGSPQHSIGISYNVYMVSQLGEKKYYQVDKDGNMGSEQSELKLRGWIIIDWTEEREKGLEQIVAAMQVLAERMGKILLDPEKTINLLESGIKLLG